jgi:NAD(P)-dependent dehydrogenase (short-subunit alcohol dehydrogenase family)
MNIVIVGCGNVGFETARLLERKHTVLLINHGRSADLDNFLQHRGDVSFAQADATDPEAVGRTMNGFVAATGRVDVLVSTVGAFSPALATEDFHGFESNFFLNVFANLVPIKAALSHMIPARSGRIIVLSSTSGVFAYPGLTAYVPAKWALTNLCRILRRDVEPHGIALDIVFPRSIRNRRSRTFLFKHGIEAEKVAAAICRATQSSRSTNRFVPRRAEVLRLLERALPWVLDRRAGLRSDRGAGFRRRQVHSVLIAGAACSRERELALLYAKSAARLFLAGPDIARLSAMRNDIERSSECAVGVFALDVADAVSVQSFAAAVPAVDLLVHATSCGSRARLVDSSLTAFDRALRSVFLGPAGLTAALLREQKISGKVLTILSACAVSGDPGCGACAAGHSALQAFTRVLRRTVGNDIQVVEAVVDMSPDGHCRELDHNGLPTDSCRTHTGLSDRLIARRIVQAERSGKEIICIPRTRKSSAGKRISRRTLHVVKLNG